MKKGFVTFFFLAWSALPLLACPVCERNQPKVLKGVVHGSGPESNWDYVIVWAAVAITVVTLYYSLRWLIRPGETSKSHIKYFILNDER